uniref:Inositol polyphosphate-related phosphatase domain-containing protein n=1 Tax=Ananas comosus var. bracteatus TaxID=296719 RepID=A0A6V7Q314_ANACO|nr:unnamed protein product [Ananas comosus var. bracteatus]
MSGRQPFPLFSMATGDRRLSSFRRQCRNHRQSAKKRFNELEAQRSESVGADYLTDHEGIETVAVEKFCGFSTNSVLCVCIVTWNMNGREVPKHNIANLLNEYLIETHSTNYLPSPSLLGEATMQSLHLYVLGPKNSEFERKELRVDKCAVGGCGGLIRRKKGAVGVYIVINRIHMVFISCHLSAHTHNVEERNSQWRHISYSWQRTEAHMLWPLTSEYLSWTDRILFKIDSSSGIDAVLHSYESLDQISSSDRKPVKAHLC